MLAWPLRVHPIAIISHAATHKLSLRHSSTLYDYHEPRLRLGHGGLGRWSGRLRQLGKRKNYSEEKPGVPE
jgi:hypothetical protein